MNVMLPQGMETYAPWDTTALLEASFQWNVPLELTRMRLDRVSVKLAQQVSKAGTQNSRTSH